MLVKRFGNLSRSTLYVGRAIPFCALSIQGKLTYEEDLAPHIAQTPIHNSFAIVKDP